MNKLKLKRINELINCCIEQGFGVYFNGKVYVDLDIYSKLEQILKKEIGDDLK